MSTENTVTVILPTPDPKLNAHAKGHWRSKTGATARLRSCAHLAALTASDGVRWPAASIEYRFYFADRRRRDSANAVHSMKAAVDGVVDSGLIPDDDWTHLTLAGVHCAVDREHPRTELVFRKAERIK